MKSNHLLLAVFLFFSCSANEKTSQEAPATDSSSKATLPQPTEDDTLNRDQIREMGIIKEVEDAGYPFMSLKIEFPERHFSEFFTINLEEAKGVSGVNLSKWKGKYVSFFYESNIQNALLDIEREGKSLLDEGSESKKSSLKKIVGKLSGADETTNGDLPSKISITNNNGESVEFEFFVTQQLVDANGKEVVGYYEERTQNKISSIRLSD
jgi:hypothetical protein